ncbi:MAG: glycosyltransferase [Thermomonas sp.]|uniref:glycosyltransferase n=1 Tax=Thermomonas sp. TaxID=1971895 RepID=UPI0039E64F2B
MDAPLVSIAVPFFNVARFLPAALDSLLAQDHPHWEALLWDDGSSDGSGNIAADYARRDPRFRLLGDGRNHGNPAALAQALAQARGDFIGVLDGDDVLEAGALSSMLAFMAAHPQLGVAYSRYVEIDEDGALLRDGKRFLTPYSPLRLLVEFMTFHFRLIRTDAYRAVGGYDATMAESADYDLCLRLSERVAIGHLPMPLYRYRIRRSSVSHAGRLLQARTSFEAALRALQRRGMASNHTLTLGLRASHMLTPMDAAARTVLIPLQDDETLFTDPAEVIRWGEGIEARQRAFIDAVTQRGLDAQYHASLRIESRHILQQRAQPCGNDRRQGSL